MELLYRKQKTEQVSFCQEPDSFMFYTCFFVKKLQKYLRRADTWDQQAASLLSGEK